MTRALILAVAAALSVIAQPAPAQEPPLQTAGAWRYRTTRAALDGRESFLAATPSTVQGLNIIGRREAADLAVLCSPGQGGLMISISWPNFVGGTAGQGVMRFRLDEGDVEIVPFRNSPTSRIVVFTPGPAAAATLLGRMATAKRLVAEAGGQEAIFDMTGLAAAAATMPASCK